MKGLARLAACMEVVAGFALAGCGGKKVTVQIPYNQPASYPVPSDVRKLAVAEFGAMSETDKRWGEVAADKLSSALDDYNKRFNRYVLVDRKRLSAILEERDKQLLVADTDTAVEFGKIADVDAMVYGTVNVIARDERGTRQTFDPMRRSMKTVPYTKRYCLASVNFTMDDVQTSKTIATVTVTREYDSEKDKSTGGKTAAQLGFSTGTLPTSDHVINALIDECIDVIIRKISPHTEVVSVELARSSNEAVKTANKLAGAGEYAEALDLYEQASRNEPGDHAAVYNAGVMHEALGNYAGAVKCYDRAVAMEPKEDYIYSRKRVRDVLAAGAD